MVRWDRSKIWDASLSSINMEFVKEDQKEGGDAHQCWPRGCAERQISGCQHGFCHSPPLLILPEVCLPLETHLLASLLRIVNNCQCWSDCLTSGLRLPPLPPATQRFPWACFAVQPGLQLQVPVLADDLQPPVSEA